MSQCNDPATRIPLRVLPDPRRMERIMRNAEAWQQQVAQESKEAEMTQVEELQIDDHLVKTGSHPGREIEKKLLESKIIERLRTVFDPELPVNIYDLGLIYAIDVADDNGVDIRMTLTAPACPAAGQIVADVQRKVREIEEVKRADVELVWDPPWCREMISEAAQLDLGLL